MHSRRGDHRRLAHRTWIEACRCDGVGVVRDCLNSSFQFEGGSIGNHERRLAWPVAPIPVHPDREDMPYYIFHYTYGVEYSEEGLPMELQVADLAGKGVLTMPTSWKSWLLASPKSTSSDDSGGRMVAGQAALHGQCPAPRAQSTTHLRPRSCPRPTSPIQQCVRGKSALRLKQGRTNGFTCSDVPCSRSRAGGQARASRTRSANCLCAQVPRTSETVWQDVRHCNYP